MIGFQGMKKKSKEPSRTLKVRWEPEITEDQFWKIDPNADDFLDILREYDTSKDNKKNKKFFEFKKAVEESVMEEGNIFYVPKFLPCLEEGEILFKENEIPTIGLSYNEWQKILDLYPIMEMGNQFHYYLFANWTIKFLIEEFKFSVEEAVESVLIDSNSIGNYWKKGKIENHISKTGDYCGWDISGNLFRIIKNKYDESFILGGGCYMDFGDMCPMADILQYYSKNSKQYEATAFLIIA